MSLRLALLLGCNLLLSASVALGEEPSSTGKLLTFDPAKLELLWQDHRWLLVSENQIIKDFGRHEADARAALRIIRDLGLNQHGTLGSPEPILEYWLADGHAPLGPCLGLHTSPIDVDHTRVEEVQRQWCLRDNYRILFNFGVQEVEARRALEILKYYRFSQIGYVGQGAPTMLVFLADSAMNAHLDVERLRDSRVANHHRSREPLMMANDGTLSQDAVNQASPEELAAAQKVMAMQRSKNQDPRYPDLANTNLSTVLPHGRQLSEPRAPLTSHGVTTERVPFDWHHVDTRKIGDDWHMVTGSYDFANFGRDEQAARQAVHVIQSFRCTDHCRIGSPQSSFSYFLTNGQAPRGTMLGVNAMPFHAAELTLKEVNHGWVVGDASHILFDFGPRQEEAVQALKAIQQHRFDRLLTVGQGPGLVFLARSK